VADRRVGCSVVAVRARALPPLWGREPTTGALARRRRMLRGGRRPGALAGTGPQAVRYSGAHRPGIQPSIQGFGGSAGADAPNRSLGHRMAGSLTLAFSRRGVDGNGRSWGLGEATRTLERAGGYLRARQDRGPSPAITAGVAWIGSLDRGPGAWRRLDLQRGLPLLRLWRA